VKRIIDSPDCCVVNCDAELNLKGRIGTESDESWLMVKPANKHLQASTAI
jgi:hypothetical protein